MIRTELNRFWVALGFLTRIPIPPSTPFSKEALNRCARYFPLVGLLLGGILALVSGLLSLWFPPLVTVLLTTIVSIRLTGAFHEDGLADSCDGLGGGWTPDQSLSIMKDSRLGTYGAVALVLSLALKLTCLTLIFAMSTTHGAAALMIGHSLSRLAPLAIMATLPYVGDRPGSKSKPLAQNPQVADLLIASAWALLPLVFVRPRFTAVALVLVSCIVIWRWRAILNRKLHGYTGDTLGASQQLVELGIYLALLWRWTST